MKRYLALAAFGAWVGGGSTAAAQDLDMHADRLAQVQKVRCEFALMSVGTWVKGEAQVETKPVKVTVAFDTIDVDQGTARVLGTFGPADIIVRLSNGTLHLVQSFREGPLYATTIFPYETRGGKLRAAHTRHEYTPVTLPGFTSSPEQYYGECELDK